MGAAGGGKIVTADPSKHFDPRSALVTFNSVDWFKKAGMSIVMVETGGDPGHAPARRTYEAAGFRLLPVARYFKSL